MSAHESWISVLRMTGPVFIFGVILPFVDIGTDARLIYWLYNGTLGCKRNLAEGWHEDCFADVENYCDENSERCIYEKHDIIASLMLGKLSNHNFLYAQACNPLSKPSPKFPKFKAKGLGPYYSMF